MDMAERMKMLYAEIEALYEQVGHISSYGNRVVPLNAVLALVRAQTYD
jgi:hypothetical protein